MCKSTLRMKNRLNLKMISINPIKKIKSIYKSIKINFQIVSIYFEI